MFAMAAGGFEREGVQDVPVPHVHDSVLDDREASGEQSLQREASQERATTS